MLVPTPYSIQVLHQPSLHDTQPCSYWSSFLLISACTIRQSPSSHVISQSCSYSPTQPPMLHPHPQSCSHQPSYIHIHNHAATNLVTSTSTTMQLPTSHALNPQPSSSQPPNAQPDKSKSPKLPMHTIQTVSILPYAWFACIIKQSPTSYGPHAHSHTVPNLPHYVFTSACITRKLWGSNSKLQLLNSSVSTVWVLGYLEFLLFVFSGHLASQFFKAQTAVLFPR